jgi:hypothetical protein
LFNLPAHPSDFYLDEEGQGDLVLINKLLEEHFFSLQRFCDLVPPEARVPEAPLPPSPPR